jgi:hypothetical protein
LIKNLPLLVELGNLGDVKNVHRKKLCA